MKNSYHILTRNFKNRIENKMPGTFFQAWSQLISGSARPESFMAGLMESAAAGLLSLTVFCLAATPLLAETDAGGDKPVANAPQDSRDTISRRGASAGLTVAQGSTSFGAANGRIFNDRWQGGGQDTPQSSQIPQQAPRPQTGVAPDGSQATRSTTDTFIGQDQEGDQVIMSRTNPRVDNHSDSSTTIIVAPEISGQWGWGPQNPQRPGGRPDSPNWSPNRPPNRPPNWQGQNPGNRRPSPGLSSPALPPASQGELPGFNPRTDSRPSDGRPGQRPPGDSSNRPPVPPANRPPTSAPGTPGRGGAGGRVDIQQLREASASPLLSWLQERKHYAESAPPDQRLVHKLAQRAGRGLVHDNPGVGESTGCNMDGIMADHLNAAINRDLSGRDSAFVSGIALSGLLAQNQAPHSDAGSGAAPDAAAQGSAGNAPADAATVTNKGAAPPRSDANVRKSERMRETPQPRKLEGPERASPAITKSQPPEPKEEPVSGQVYPADRKLPKLKLRPYLSVPEAADEEAVRSEGIRRTMPPETVQRELPPEGVQLRLPLQGAQRKLPRTSRPLQETYAGEAAGVTGRGGIKEYRGLPADATIQRGRIYSPANPNATFDSGPRPTTGPLSRTYEETPERLHSGPDHPGGAGWSKAPRP